MMNGTPEKRRAALTVLLFVAFVCAAYVAAPLWVGLVLGAVMAFTGEHAYERLSRRLGNRRGLAATIVTLGSGFVCAILGAAALYAVTNEIVVLIHLLRHHVSSTSLEGMIGPRAAQLLERMGISQAEVVARLQHQVEAAASSLASAVGVIMATVTNAILGLVMALITEYYVLIEWPGLTRRAEAILPIEPKYTRALIRELREVGRSALVGTVATGLVQGVIAGIGFAIAGVGQIVTWSMLTAIASFVPLVGTAVVWAPVGAYLMYSGRIVAGIFVLAWGVFVVMLTSDYVIRPRIVGKSGHAHPLLTLVALLGGLEAMGLVGLIVGPILMSLFVAVLRMYEREQDASM